MKITNIFFLVLIISFSSLSAQFQDNFTDGDFTQNPIWNGNDAKFEVNSTFYLHLKSTGTDTAYLCTSSSIINNSEWRFYVKQSFNSSANNHSRVYLASNQSNLRGNLNGYYVQIGGTNDNISLWRQDGANLTEIITGSIANTGKPTNKLRIKVICDANGKWDLFADDQGGTNFISEGSVTDNTYNNCSYFGIFCKHTSSNATKFYFDDFVVGAIQYDTLPPEIINYEVINANKLRLYFNETVDINSAEITQNYTVNNGLGHPNTANRLNSDSSIVELYFNNGFTYAQAYKLEIEDVEDKNGNAMSTIILPFMWYNIVQGDIVINEIMADPSPQVGLPDAEYIELYNKTGITVDLSNWILRIGNSEKIIPSGKILPDSFVIIGHEDNETILSTYGSFIGLSSFSLKNSGTSLTLKTNNNALMHNINYNINWYKNDVKAEGGWSLEQIDPNSYCVGEKNWRASISLAGGTPGSKNSIDAINIDNELPNIEKVVVLNISSLKVYFNKSMDSTLAKNPNYYLISNSIGKPLQISATKYDYRAFTLQLSNPLQLGIIYTLTIDTGIASCGGIKNTKKLTAEFGIPEIPDSNDILINEVLFNPRDNGVDYVELYNNSNKIIDLKFLRLANWNIDDNNYDNVKDITTEGYQIFPNEFYVLSTSNDKVSQQYYIENIDKLIEVEALPSLSNTEGNIYLLTNSLQTIDAMNYDEEMHYALLNNPDGISLERINYTISSLDKSNWRSAAIPGKNAEGFGGTPTYTNSQKSNGSTNESEWSISPDIFSPDNDGYDDFVEIKYKFKEGGSTANITIYDSRGRLIRSLSNGILLETEGVQIWDGIDNNGNKASIGIYIVYIEVINLSGSVEQYKLSIVLGGKM